MVLLQRLTAEAMLGAPRRSPAQPNHDGTLALYTVSTHAFGDKTSSEVRVMDVDTGSSWRIADAEKVHDVNWVPGPRNDVIFLKSGEKGVTTIGVVSDVRGKENTYSVAEINAPIQALRMRWIEPGRVAFAVVGLVGPDGQLFNDEAAEKKSTIQVYDDFRVRSWNAYLKAQKYMIWYTTLAFAASPIFPSTGKWKFAAPLLPLVEDMATDVPDGAYEDGLNQFDLGPEGVAFVTENASSTRPYLQGASSVFYMPVRWPATQTTDGHADVASLEMGAEQRKALPVRIALPQESTSLEQSTSLPQCPEAQAVSVGYSSNVRISADGTTLGYIFAFMSNPTATSVIITAVPSSDGACKTDPATRRISGLRSARSTPLALGLELPPSSFEWASKTGDAVFVSAEDHGRMVLWRLRVPRLFSRSGGPVPWNESDPFGARALTSDGNVTAYFPLRQGSFDRLLVTSDSIVDNSLWTIVDSSSNQLSNNAVVLPRVVSSATQHGRKFGLDHSEMVGEFYFSGDKGAACQCFVIRPMGWRAKLSADPQYKFPFLLFPHGGPESSWRDGWSSRWNLALWAQKGYVVLCPNVAGSTGFGVDFTARIYGSWGGAPFNDLRRLMAHLEAGEEQSGVSRVVPTLDFERAGLAGASYGGYMLSWIFGEADVDDTSDDAFNAETCEFDYSIPPPPPPKPRVPLARWFRAAVWHDGIFNLPTFMLQTDYCTMSPDFGGAPYPWYPGPKRRVVGAAGKDGKGEDLDAGVALGNYAALAKWNPADPARLARWASNAPPTLVIHSERDYRCPITEGLAVFKTLQAMGVPSRFVTYPDECHFVLNPENALQWNNQLEAWLGKWVLGME